MRSLFALWSRMNKFRMRLMKLKQSNVKSHQSLYFIRIRWMSATVAVCWHRYVEVNVWRSHCKMCWHFKCKYFLYFSFLQLCSRAYIPSPCHYRNEFSIFVVVAISSYVSKWLLFSGVVSKEMLFIVGIEWTHATQKLSSCNKIVRWHRAVKQQWLPSVTPSPSHRIDIFSRGACVWAASILHKCTCIHISTYSVSISSPCR